MRFFPYEKFNIETTRTKEEIISTVRLNTNLGKLMPFLGSRHKKLFNGMVVNDDFKIAPAIHYRNSFIPIIEGQVKQKEDGSSIDITMRLNELAKTFMIIWLSFCAMFLGIPIIAGKTFSFGNIMPLIMFVFGFGLTHIAYRFEAKKCKKRLLEMLQR